MEKEYKVTAHFADKTTRVKFVKAPHATLAKQIAERTFRNFIKLTAKELK